MKPGKSENGHVFSFDITYKDFLDEAMLTCKQNQAFWFTDLN